MEERILQIIKGEDSKNPLTDEEIASRLQVFREDVTTVRREHHIPDSRKRRKPVIFEDMKRILTEHPDVSDRGLTRMLEEAGYKKIVCETAAGIRAGGRYYGLLLATARRRREPVWHRI
mgnify:CR=1 FL=1